MLNKSEGKFREFHLAIFNLNKCNFKIQETKNHTIKFQKHKLFCQVISGTDNLTVFVNADMTCTYSSGFTLQEVD